MPIQSPYPPPSLSNLPTLLVSDLDGTLLNPSHKISLRSAQTLAKAQSSPYNIQIMIASGRSPRSVQVVIDQFQGLMIPDFVICCNGALNYNPRTKAVSYPITLDNTVAIEIMDKLRDEILRVESRTEQDGVGKLREVEGSRFGRPGFAFEILGGEEGTFFICDKEWELERKHSIYYQYLAVDDLVKFLSTPVDPNIFLPPHQQDQQQQQQQHERKLPQIIKMMALDRNRSAVQVFESLPSSIQSPTNCTVTYSGPFFLEISAKGINKGLGLSTFCNGQSIPAEKVVAFGDLLNDLEMLTWAGNGFCMSNGHENVKKIANKVVGSNAEDGVAVEVESWLS